MERFEAGEDFKSLAKDYPLSEASLREKFKKVYGIKVPISSRFKVTEETKIEIRQKKKEGVSAELLAVEYDIGIAIVYRYCKEK